MKHLLLSMQLLQRQVKQMTENITEKIFIPLKDSSIQISDVKKINMVYRNRSINRHTDTSTDRQTDKQIPQHRWNTDRLRNRWKSHFARIVEKIFAAAETNQKKSYGMTYTWSCNKWVDFYYKRRNQFLLLKYIHNEQLNDITFVVRFLKQFHHL